MGRISIAEEVVHCLGGGVCSLFSRRIDDGVSGNVWWERLEIRGHKSTALAFEIRRSAVGKRFLV